MDFDSYIEKLTRLRSIPRLAYFEDLLRAFTPGERFALYGLTLTLGVSTIALLVSLNAHFSVYVPTYGGSLTEGIVGAARFVNPILAISQPDEDLAQLVYSGLTRVRPDGSVATDLASGYTVSGDGTTYTFTIRPDATFHDKQPVTAADVLFTIGAAQNPAIKSPRRADWEGVQVSAPDDHTVVFKLPHPYAPFLENTALGILPKHIWGTVPAEEFPFSPANTNPVGSGPYRVARVHTDTTGTATRYDLYPFANYALGRPFLKRITFKFYPKQEGALRALDTGEVDALAGIAPQELNKITRTDVMIAHRALPRVFGVFFNQNHAPALADASARAALVAAVDNDVIIKSVLNGYGRSLESAIPPGVVGTIVPTQPVPFVQRASSTEIVLSAERASAARSVLAKGGWTFDEATGVWSKKKVELSIDLATADEPELVATANAIAKYWRAAGIKVSVQIYPLSELNTNVIRPRAYDAILFGEVVGRTADLFAFWHSSQRNDPGLNLAMYANSTVDALLSQARTTTDKRTREKIYERFNKEIATDVPALFLYAPEFVYVVPDTMRGVRLGTLSTPSERFLNAHEWYTDTERVWNIFTNTTN